MATEINIPVRLKILQDSISQFQKILDNLQPNTKNWKDLSRIISQMTSESQKLQAQLSTPFSSQKQFSQTERTIDRLEEAAARVQVVMKGLKFSDIQLTPAQSNQLQAFNDEINTIRDSYKKLQEETKQKLLSNSNNNSLLGAIPKKDVLTKDFDGIKSAVDQHVKDLERSVENQKKQFERLRSNIELGEKATALTTSGKGLTREALGDSIFDKYLSETEKGLRIKSWNNGVTKQALLTELEKMFSLNPGELQSLAGKTIDEINKAFQEMGKKGNFNPLSGIISRGKNDKKNEPIFNSTATQIQEQLRQYQVLQAEIDKLKATNLDPVSSVNTTKIDELTEKMNTLRTSIMANVIGNNNYKSSMQDFSAGLGQARTALQETNAEFLKMQAAARSFDSLKMTITNFLGFYQILNLTKRAIQEAANHIKELDTVMNKISIVTDMDTSDLWGQIDQYSSMAQRYGTTIKGAYEVSQIYYQQGLDTADVLTLTNETLKLAKISGLDYASTTDYMTTAIRGFKMEMSEAATVVDVYSALAANTAVSQEELAVAMSKTASSMESVGSTFQETSAMIGTMVAVTRESATNIGSAMKSIASRYGELTKDPAALMDSEGEAMSFNKVDAALQSVGISMKTTEGQFREFTDVIIELGEKWAQLESTQQRYIATQFAGNRQQSRFLALVSNIDLLKSNIEVAENSEDVGTVQALKALDSLESKIEQVRVAYQQFYTTIGIESIWKGFLDGARSVVDTLNGMPKLFGKIPIAAVNAISIVVSLIKNLALRGLAFVSRELVPSLAAGLKSGEPQMQKAGESLFERLNQAFLGKYAAASATGQQIAQAYAKGVESGFINPNKKITQDQYNQWLNTAMTGTLGDGSNLFGIAQDRQTLINNISSSGILAASGLNILRTGSQQEVIDFITTLRGAIAAEGETATQATGGIAAWSAAHQAALGNIMGVAQAVQLVALAIPTVTREGKTMSGVLQAVSGAGIAVVAVIKAIGAAAEGTKVAMPWMAIASGIIAVISGITQALQANSVEAKLDEITKKAQALSDQAKQLKSNFNILDTSIKKINELEKARYDSAEAAEEYQTAVDKLAETYPELVASYNLNNEAVLNVNAMEEILAKARDESAAATLRAAQAEAEKAKIEKEAAINKLHTENDALEEYTLLGGKADVNLTEKRKLYRHQVIGEVSTQELEELYDFIDIIKNAGEQHQTDKIIETYQELNKYLVSKNINLDSDLTSAILKAVNAAYSVKGYDSAIENANKVSVSAFMNDYYGNSKSSSILKDNKGLMAAATDALYNSVWNGQYDTITLTENANQLFSGVDALYSGISDSRREEIDTILNNSYSYSKSDIQTLLPELADTEWINDYFDRQIQYNKQQLINKIDQLKTNREAYDNGKLDESLTLLPEQIQQFESIIDDNITLDLRNLMTSGINQAQNLKKTGQNPQTFIDNFINFYNQVSNLPAKLRNDLISKFSANGFTQEGISKTLDWISDNEEIQKEITSGQVNFSSLEEMQKSFVPNYALTVAALEDQLTSNLGDIESLFADLQNGIKGSQLGKTIAKAKELGLDLDRSQFNEDGDKFILQYEEFANLISGINDIYTTALPEKEKFEKAYQGLTRLRNGQKEFNFHRIKDIQAILGSRFYDYFDANDRLKEEVTQDQVYDAIQEAYNSTDASLSQYYAWLATIEAHLTKIADWKRGNYSTLEGKVDLTQLDSEGNIIDTAYKRVQYLAAHPEAYTESELKEADVSNAVEGYQKGISSLLTDLSKYGADYLINRGQSYEGVAESTVDEIRKLANDKGPIEAIRQYGKSASMSIQEINEAIINSLQIGKGSSVASMISGRTTTLSDINKLISDYKIGDQAIESFLDDNNNLTGSLANIYDYDALTGELTLKNEASLEQVLTAYREAFNIEIQEGTKLYDKIQQQWINDFIANEDKNDIGKQMSTAISSLSSAKIGTRVDLSKSPELEAKIETILGKQLDGYYEVTSEWERDNLILALQGIDVESDATIKELQKTIQNNRSKRAARQKVSGVNTTREDIKNYAKNVLGFSTADYWNDRGTDIQAESLGYTWDKDLEQYRATADRLSVIDQEIADAIANNASEDYINELRQERTAVASYLRKKDPKREALQNLLNNYKDAADYIDEFNTQFGTDLEGQGIVSKVDGKSIVDIAKLDTIVPEYTDLFDQVISQIADEYINNAQKAGSLMTQGTTSKVEMNAFQKAYEEIMGQGAIADFIYDAVTHTMVFNPSQLRDYLEGVAAREEFGLTPDQQKDWVDSQIDALTADNLDFSKVLEGTASEKETNELKRNLENYAKTHLPNGYELWPIEDQQEYIENYANRVLAGLSEGGQAAIDAMKSTGKELSTEEIRNAYRAQVAPLSELADTLSTLEAGSVVTANQIDALNKIAGFKVNADGVVESVGKLSQAYRSIYYQMKATGEATVSELNKVVGNLLDNRDGEQQIIGALNNATNMTYSQLAEIYTQAGKELTESMVVDMRRNGILKALGGNKVMIADFERFAKSMGWEANSEEYINALSAYRDGIISYDKKMGDNIRANFDAITNAKVGDKINLTQLLSKFPEFETELEATFGDIITDGVLTVRDALTLPQLAVAIGNKAVQEGGMLVEELEAFVASVHDNILNGITGAFDYSTNGTNSIASMQAFAQEYNTLTGENKDYSELFRYDTLFDTFKLSGEIYQRYLEAQKVQLEQMGLSGEAINEYINDQTDTVLRNSIELDSLLNADTNKSRNDEANKLIQQIRGLNNYKNLFSTDTLAARFSQGGWSEAIAEQYDQLILETLESGGQAAVDLLKKIKPDASSDELEAAFNSQINKLTDVLSQVSDLVAGEFVGTEGKLHDILARAGAVDDNGVVKAGFDMVEVYAAIYAEMTKTAGATTAGLNDAYAKLLTAQDQTNIDITEALQNGNGMSYADFGNLLAKYDIKFEDYMTDHWDTVMRDGFGNIRITDWEGFAKNIFKTNDLDAIRNTNEYISAFKAYNDGLIELNKNTEEAITEEIQQIADAKAGDWLNLTELWTALGDSVAEKDWTAYMEEAGRDRDQARSLANQAWAKSVSGQLEQWGATFENGILKLGDNVNLLGIAQTLESAAEQAGLELGNGLEEVKDTILDILGAYTEAITNGIKGGLDNFSAQDLRKKADNIGVTNLHFEQTIDGLKLSQQSAIELYQALSKVDALQGQIVFEELSESLKESNENFATTSSLLRHIADLTGKIQSADEKTSSARLEQYKAELEVAKEIVTVRSATEDDSFNFMNQEIPSGQNNPLNYAKNWTQAVKSIKEAYKVWNTKDLNAGGVKRTKTGYMGYEDFYNVVNELNNMAGLGANIELAGVKLDGSLEAASELIIKGIDTLTAVDTGDMMINIGALGISLAQSGSELEKGIDTGMDAVADAEIKALDGMIAMLELIVAMEELGDVAGEDMVIELPDIVTDNKDLDEDADGLSDKFESWRDTFLKLGSKSRELAETITINGQNMVDWLSRAAEEWTADDAAVLDALYQAAISNDWNTDDVGASLQQMLNSGKFGELAEGFSIEVGDITYTVSNGVVIEAADWTTKDAQDVLKQYKTRRGYGSKNDAKARAEITAIIQKYLNGEGASPYLSVEEILKIRHTTLIQKDTNGKDYIEGPDGTHYERNSSGWRAAIQAEILSDQGISKKDIDINYNAGTATATTTYGIKNKVAFTITSDENTGKVDWQLDDEELSQYIGKNRSFSSQDEVLHALYDGLKANADAGSETAKKLVGDLDFDQFVYSHFGVHVAVQTEVYKDNEQVDNASTDKKFRNAAEEVLNYADTEIEKLAEKGSDGRGKTTITLKNGYTIVMDTDDITLDDGSYDSDLVKAKIREAMGIDEALKDTITQGIQGALPSLTDALSSLDPNPAQKVADAIKQIGDNAQTAITRIASLAQNLKGLPQQKESNGSKNSGTGAGAHEPEAITGEVSIEGTEKAEQDINAFSDTIGSLNDTVQGAAGSVSSTASNMASKYSQAMSEMDQKTQDAAGSTRTHLEEMLTAALTTIGVIVTLIASLPTHISITTEFITKTEDSDYITTGGYAGETGEIKQTVRYTTEGEEKIEKVKKEASQEVTTPVNADTDAATLFVNNLIALIETARTVPVNIEVISDSIQSYLEGKTFIANATITASGGPNQATGNIGLAKAKGTLMGELGPELVVSNGRYFVAGQNGAEMVNLADDAIVFNHLQTEQLLKHGMSSGRGKAVTSEKNAVAFATGNTGPAMASASAALNALKQLRAMWESLRSASISDLAGAGGGGGGGGGDKAVDPSIWIDTVERWYNLMQKIAKLEKEITHEETLRSKLESDWNANGNHYYASQKRSLEALRDQIDAQEQLNLSRQAYYDQRVEALEKSPFGKLIRFDDEGQMFFQEGAMEWLTNLAGFDSEGKANYTDEEKYDILMKAGYGDYMKYDSDGGEIKKDSDGDGEVTDDELQTFYGDATKAFWDRIDDYKETTQSLWDSIKEGEDSLLDLQADQNGLLEEIRENQMEVEDEVLKAVEDLRQREIDALQDERDKLEESTQKYIDGLTDALNREQEMYQNQEDETSLNQQRRRLAILQRSGGSAEDIASLRSEIDSSERERYFNLQQQQIDAIQAASDLEIERMDSQIEIMTETLEYQKEYGLLWSNVYAVMQESSEKIVSFITNSNSEFWANSQLSAQKVINEQLFKAQQWEEYRKDLTDVKASIDGDGTSGGIKENVALMVTMTREQMKDNDYSIFDEAMKKEFGNDYDKNGIYKDLFYSEYQEHGDLTKVDASVRKKYSDDKKAAEAAAAVTTTSIASGGGGGNSNAATSGSSGGSNNNKGKTVTSEGWAAKGGKHRWVTFYSDGTSTETRQGDCDSNGAKKRVGDKTYYSCSVCGNLRGEVEQPVEQKPDWSETRNRLESKGISPNTGTAGSAATATTKTIEQAAKNIVNNGMNFIDNIWKSVVGGKKASGGYVNHGVYELGELGTETVLTASQTKVLRDNILSNRPNSLISLLRSYNENYDGINSPLTGITPVEDNSVTIERVEMTMEVKQIANDYDAKRAGEQALNEMMRIARKTGATNSIRR